MKKLLLLSTLFYFGFSSSITAQCHPDFDALMALYNATDGPNWVYNEGWEGGAAGSDCDVCEWDYVQCNSDDRVTGLSMFSNGGPGVLPPEIGDIEFLKFLDLSYWELSGEIPSEIGQLSNLVSLRLTDNEFTGAIPTSIGNLSNLEVLNLGLCGQLSGSLPTSLGNLNNLQKLFIHDTNISGSIPSGMGNMPDIEWIEFSNNQFTGSIPTDLGNLTNINELDLSNNNLTGNIPATFGQLTNAFYIGLDNNDLSGCIPNELYVHCSPNVTVDIGVNPQLPNGGDFSAFCADLTGACDPTSTNDIKVKALSFYPNPATDVLTIDPENEMMDQVIINTVFGQQVFNQTYGSTQSQMTIELQQIPAGIYIISGYQEGVKVGQSKLVIAR